MILEYDILAQKPKNEIRSMLVQRGAGWMPWEDKKALINRYIELASIVQPNEKKRNDNKQDAVSEGKKPTTGNGHVESEKEILKALAQFKDDGLEIKLSDDGSMWYFKYGKKEDSGTMRQPLKTIVRCAEMLMR